MFDSIETSEREAREPDSSTQSVVEAGGDGASAPSPVPIWKVEANDEYAHTYTIVQKNGEWCSPLDQSESLEQREQERRLIEAAPQLLAALRELRESLDPDDWMGDVTMHDFIDAAIAQATGSV